MSKHTIFLYKIYYNCTIELQDELERVRSELHCNDIVMLYNSHRNYYLQAPVDVVSDCSTTHILLNMYKKYNYIQCSTKLLQQYNIIMNQQYQQIIGLYARIIEPLLLKLRSQLVYLCQCSESIAYLDVMCSYTTLQKTRINYCQPDILPYNNTMNNSIHIENSRHPIMEIDHQLPFVSNTINITNNILLQIITGPNNSGILYYIS